MTIKKYKVIKYIYNHHGFTLVELMVAITLMAIMLTIAAPSFLQWRESLQYREAGRGLTTFIRTARSEAIQNNRQYRVQINIAAKTYQLQRGESALASSWTVLDIRNRGSITSPSISLAAPNTDIVCNPNGTMEFSSGAITGNSPTQITIFDNRINGAADAASQRYRIDLFNTGRIRGNIVGTADGAPDLTP